MSLTAVPAMPVPTQDTASPQVQKVLDDMKATAGSRFNAAKRLEANDLNLTGITALTSAYIIALTVLPYFWKLPQKVTDTLNLTTVVLSVIVLVSALLHNSKRDAVNAEQHHRSALEIKEIHREMLAHGSDIEQEALLRFVERYSAILQKYTVNHNDLDYKKFQTDRPEQFAYLGRLGRYRTLIALAIRDNVQKINMAVITLGCLWLVFFYALPHAS
jgi:hypothetical protein